MATYVVAPGDTLFALARRFATTATQLQTLNNLADPDQLFVGQTLVVPDPAAGPVPAPATDPDAVPAPPALPVELFGARASDPSVVGLIDVFHRWADAYQLSRSLLQALAFVESSWRVDARSPSGAVGLCQLLPSTAAWVASTLLGGAPLDVTRAEDNVQLGARYLRYLIDVIGNEGEGVAAYYQGPGSVRRDGVSAAGAAYVNRVATARPWFS